MARSKLSKLCLESKAADMSKNGMSSYEIAKALSSEARQTISADSVQRYLKTLENDKKEVVEKSDKLKAKIVEAEINTVEEAMYCVNTLKWICEEARESKDYHVLIQAIGKIYPALDVINKVLGKYQVLPQNTITANDVQINLQLIDCSKRGD